MTYQPPFALFVLDKDIGNSYINDTLTRAYNDDYQSNWNFWVATDSYTEMPPLQQARQPPPPASKPPIPSDFKSPWIYKTAEACAAFLHAMPREENAYPEPVNRFVFTALTEFSEEDDTVLMFPVVLEHEEGESREDRNMLAKNEDGSIKIEFFPVATERVQMSMWTNNRLKFAEKIGNYQKSRMAKGEPDCSQGKRY